MREAPRVNENMRSNNRLTSLLGLGLMTLATLLFQAAQRLRPTDFDHRDSPIFGSLLSVILWLAGAAIYLRSLAPECRLRSLAYATAGANLGVLSMHWLFAEETTGWLAYLLNGLWWAYAGIGVELVREARATRV